MESKAELEAAAALCRLIAQMSMLMPQAKGVSNTPAQLHASADVRSALSWLATALRPATMLSTRSLWPVSSAHQ
jgi:hypothetical protein